MRAIKDSTTIASKISRADKEKLHAIADYLGLSFYSLVQSILMTIIRYWDRGGFLTAEHYIMVEAFANVLKSVSGSHIPLSARNNDKDHIVGAILFVERKGEARPQLMAISKDRNGNMSESYNYDTMLSDFLNAINPDCLQHLKDEAKYNGYFSITHTLCKMITQRSASAKEDDMREEIAEMFNDIRISSGQSINDDTHYKRKPNVGDYTIQKRNLTYRADL